MAVVKRKRRCEPLLEVDAADEAPVVDEAGAEAVVVVQRAGTVTTTTMGTMTVVRQEEALRLVEEQHLQWEEIRLRPPEDVALRGVGRLAGTPLRLRGRSAHPSTVSDCECRTPAQWL